MSSYDLEKNDFRVYNGEQDTTVEESPSPIYNENGQRDECRSRFLCMLRIFSLVFFAVFLGLSCYHNWGISRRPYINFGYLLSITYCILALAMRKRSERSQKVTSFFFAAALTTSVFNLFWVISILALVAFFDIPLKGSPLDLHFGVICTLIFGMLIRFILILVDAYNNRFIVKFWCSYLFVLLLYIINVAILNAWGVFTNVIAYISIIVMTIAHLILWGSKRQ